MFLDRHIEPTSVGFEWGAGASTIWFASRCLRLTSIEHQSAWFNRVSDDLEKRGLASKVDLRLYEHSPVTKMAPGYVDAINEISDSSLDFALVDGSKRIHCAMLSLIKIKPGGLLILDDANRYFQRDGSNLPAWDRFAIDTKTWHQQWFRDGICETSIWIKPVTA